MDGRCYGTEITWSNARIQRNETLYIKRAAIYEPVKVVKKYVRAIYGPNSEHASKKAESHKTSNLMITPIN